LAQIIETFLGKLSEGGATLIEADSHNLAQYAAPSATMDIVFYEAPRDISYYLYSNNCSVTLRDILNLSNDSESLGIYQANTSNLGYREALKVRDQLRAAYQKYFSENNIDVIIVPTTALTAVPIGQKNVKLGNKEMSVFAAFIRNTQPASTAGVPCISIPAGKTQAGLPVGLELVGLDHYDRTLLTIAHVIQTQIRL